MTFTEQVTQLLDSPELVSVKQSEAISSLHSVYKQLFGEAIKKQCGDCLTKALLRIRKYVYLQSQNENFNLETMKKFEDKNFVLAKDKALDVGKLGIIVTNDNLDDDTAVLILTEFPGMVKYFDKYPTNEAGELDLTGFESDAAKKITAGAEAKKIKDNALKVQAEAIKTPNVVNPPVPEAPVVPSVENTQTAAVPVAPVVPVKTEAGIKESPAKPSGTRLPVEGETIEQAAERHAVSARTIERDMKAAGVDVKAWKLKTVLPDTATAEEKEADKNEEAAEGYVDFEVTQEWLDANAEVAAAEDVKLGDVIEIPAPKTQEAAAE